MSPQAIQAFRPGTLWSRVVSTTEAALARGALVPVATDHDHVDQDGIEFVVRIARNLVRKQQVTRRYASPEAAVRNPFLPYEQDLYVADVLDSHVCLLNKFNAVDYHLLIITRAFEHQDAALTAGDFDALSAVLGEINGLVFYNAGEVAGASQPHKHIQLVPFPLTPGHDGVPMDALMGAVGYEPQSVPGLGFVQAAAGLADGWWNAGEPGKDLLTMYRRLRLACAMAQEPAPYNLLVTRHWMMLVPRSRECFGTMSINALGFAGAFFVRDQAELDSLKQAGPLNALRSVAVER